MQKSKIIFIPIISLILLFFTNCQNNNQSLENGFRYSRLNQSQITVDSTIAALELLYDSLQEERLKLTGIDSVIILQYEVELKKVIAKYKTLDSITLETNKRDSFLRIIFESADEYNK